MNYFFGGKNIQKTAKKKFSSWLFFFEPKIYHKKTPWCFGLRPWQQRRQAILGLPEKRRRALEGARGKFLGGKGTRFDGEKHGKGKENWLYLRKNDF